jgi:hypothetical protein
MIVRKKLFACLLAIFSPMSTEAFSCSLNGTRIEFPHTLCDSKSRQCARYQTSIEFLGRNALLRGLSGEPCQNDGFILQLGSYERPLQTGDLPAKVRNRRIALPNARFQNWLSTLSANDSSLRLEIRWEAYNEQTDFIRGSYSVDLKLMSCTACTVNQVSQRVKIKPYSDWEKVLEDSSLRDANCSIVRGS